MSHAVVGSCVLSLLVLSSAAGCAGAESADAFAGVPPRGAEAGSDVPLGAETGVAAPLAEAGVAAPLDAEAGVAGPLDAEAGVDAPLGTEAGVDAALGAEPGLEDAGDTALYDPDRLLEVSLSLAQADWDRIRFEGRSLNQVFTGCDDPTFGYTLVPADALIDGQSVNGLSVRKKGYLGSLSAVKPSLKLDFAEYDASQRLWGAKRLTLNNSRSDASLMHQCLAYGVFAAAGLPAPRCSFARVTTNGQELGIYVNVEPVKKPLLRRFFASDRGDLYEGNAGADFRSELLHRFEKKTNEEVLDRTPLERVRMALESTGEQMLAELEQVLDVEQYLRFWAVETLVAQWDGYSGNTNNFFAYHDPLSGKLSFLPWGTDDTFEKVHPFLPPGARPPVTYAHARLARRLYEYEPTRARYREVLQQLLDTVWDEARLLGEIDRMAALVGQHAAPAQVAALRSFVEGRRAEIAAELAVAALPWTIPERAPATCQPQLNTDVSATFATHWGAIDAPQPAPETSLDIQVDGERPQFSSVLGGAGVPTVMIASGLPALRLMGVAPDGALLVVEFLLGPALPSQPGEVQLHGLETLGVVLAGRAGGTFTVIGYIGEGTLTFEQAGTTPAAPLVGRFAGKFIQTRPRSSVPP